MAPRPVAIILRSSIHCPLFSPNPHMHSHEKSIPTLINRASNRQVQPRKKSPPNGRAFDCLIELARISPGLGEVLFAGGDDLENRLGLQDGLPFGEGMIGMNVEFTLPSLEIHEGEGG